MTPREIARIEALSLALREEALMERARTSHDKPGPKAGLQRRLDERRNKRSAISTGLYVAAVEYARAHPEATNDQVAEGIGRGTYSVGLALGRARRLGELPPRAPGRKSEPGSRRSLARAREAA